MFVDDSCLHHAGNSIDKTSEKVQENVKHDAVLWAKCLWVSDGAANLLKSLFLLMHFTFTPDGTPILQNVQNGFVPVSVTTSKEPIKPKQADMKSP